MGEHKAQSPQADLLFKAILSLKTTEECYDFFEDLCTMKEIADMAQRVETASMLLKGRTYEQIVKDVEISTATISRINRCHPIWKWWICVNPEPYPCRRRMNSPAFRKRGRAFLHLFKIFRDFMQLIINYCFTATKYVKMVH